MPTREKQSSGGAWTDGERFKFLALAVTQMENDGGKVDLKKIAPKMGGRTIKSLTHMMTKLRQEAVNGDAASSRISGAAAAATTNGQRRGRVQSTAPATASTGQKRKTLSNITKVEDDDDLDEYERFIGKKHRTAAKKEDEDKDYGKSLMRPPPTPALPVPKPQMANQVQYIKSEPEQKSLMAIGKKNDDNELAHEQEQELELERQLERQLEWQHEQERRETAPSPTATMDEVYKAVANARRAAAAAREPARAFSATEPEWDTDDF